MHRSLALPGVHTGLWIENRSMKRSDYGIFFFFFQFCYDVPKIRREDTGQRGIFPSWQSCQDLGLIAAVRAGRMAK